MNHYVYRIKNWLLSFRSFFMNSRTSIPFHLVVFYQPFLSLLLPNLCLVQYHRIRSIISNNITCFVCKKYYISCTINTLQRFFYTRISIFELLFLNLISLNVSAKFYLQMTYSSLFLLHLIHSHISFGREHLQLLHLLALLLPLFL